MRKKLIILWSVYALMVTGLAYEALFGIGKNGGIFSVLLLLVAPALVLRSLFAGTGRVIKGEAHWAGVSKREDYKKNPSPFDSTPLGYWVLGVGKR